MTKEELLYEFHNHWSGCKRCPLGKTAFTHVFGEGGMSPKVVFVGEGPGVSEDVLGQPFIGPSGRLLRKAIVAVGISIYDCFFTNLVACRPCDGTSKPNRPPNFMEIETCEERLRTLVNILKPRMLVAVGKLAEEELMENYSHYWIRAIKHPSYILRNGGERAKEFSIWLKSIKEIKILLEAKHV